MRVLFLSQIVPYPPHGGVLQRGYNLLRELGRRNDVFLLAFVHTDVLGTAALVEQSKRELGKYCRHTEYFALWPKRSPLIGKLGYLWGGVSTLPFSVLAHRSRPFAAAIGSLVARECFDLVHFDTLALAQFRHLVGATPSVVTHHNIESQLLQRRAERENRGWARRYLADQASKMRAYEASQCGKFDLNIVVSDVDGVALRANVGDVRTTTIANGVDVAYFRPEGMVTEESPPTLIYTGGMNMFANSDAVLYFLREIWPLVKQRMPQSRFFAVGQDPPAELIAIARGRSDVVVTGYVEDIRPLVARASVYVVPIRVGGGTRLKVLDAMAMGKAIVATRIGAEGLHVTDGKDILLADAPRDFADATLRALGDTSLRARLGQQARARVEGEYSWDMIGLRLQAAYASVARVARTTAPVIA